MKLNCPPGGFATALLVVALGSAAAARAATFSTGFGPSDPLPGATFGTAAVDTAGGVGNSGVLKLTTANGQAGFLVLEDLDGGKPAGAFVASFKLRMGSESTVLHGDGVSFNLGPDIPDDVFPLPEEGTGSGLRVSFDSFNNGGPANEGPAIEVTFNNRIIATRPVDFLSAGTGFVPVKIELHREGTLDVTYGTNEVFKGLLCCTPITGRFSFAANAGAERFVGDPVDQHWIDDLSLATSPAPGSIIQSATPRGSDVPPDAVVDIELEELTAEINQASIVVKFDGTPVTVTITKAPKHTSITYDPPGLLTPGSTHVVELNYAEIDHANSPTQVSYSFAVPAYATLPPGYAVSASAVNTGAPGFKVRTHQVSASVGTSVQRAELQLADKLPDPLDPASVLRNVADLGAADADGTFSVPGVIDFSSTTSPAGYFQQDVPAPGLTGTDQYALEITTFLNLAPGVFTFGVNAVRNYNTTAPGSYRESGFRLTAGQNPRDLFAPEIAVFDKGRPEGEKQFSFVVQQAGIYPFRLLWFSGVGESSLEWYQITPQGTRILVGDVASGGLTAYREAKVTHPYIQYTTNPRPGEVNVPAGTPINFTVVDGSSPLTADSLRMTLNGVAAAATAATDATHPGQSVVSFQPASPLAAGITNTVKVTFTDGTGTAYDQQWSFVVAGNQAIPGLIAVEAEHFDLNTPIEANEHAWEFSKDSAGFSGEGAMVALPDVNLNVNVDTAISPRLDYKLNFAIAGKYYVWMRALADSAPGTSQNDSANVGLDGVLPDSSSKITGFPPGGFVWSRTTVAATPATIVVPSAGPHVVSVWMREDGFIFDKLLLTTNNAYVPTRTGPPETTSTPVPPVLSYTVTAGGVKLSWTNGGALQGAPAVTGPYTVVPGGGTSPVTITSDQPTRFFRVAN